jgi:hypothetical protein
MRWVLEPGVEQLCCAALPAEREMQQAAATLPAAFEALSESRYSSALSFKGLGWGLGQCRADFRSLPLQTQMLQAFSFTCGVSRCAGRRAVATAHLWMHPAQ